MPVRAGRAVVLLILATLGSVAAGQERPNLLLVTIDALRADHCGCYGYPRDTTPVLDALAERGTLLERVVVPLPRTTQALASLLTGRSPLDHGVLDLQHRLDDGFLTLAEVLTGQGYATGSFVNHPLPLLSAEPRGNNLGQGFRVRQQGPGLVGKAVDWIARAPEPFFCWVHLLDPHWDYNPPPETNLFVDPDYPHERYVELVRAVTQGMLIHRNDWTPEDVAHARDLYDGDVRAADGKLGRILEAVGAGRLERTNVAVLADHGEAFGEHGYHFAHGEVVYDEVLLVPWVMAGPGTAALHPRFAGQVSLMDAAPTLLTLVGLEPPEDFAGLDLVPWLRISIWDRLPWRPWERPPRPHLFGISDTSRFPENPNPYMRESRGRQRFHRTGGWKLVVEPWKDREDEIRLYDLAQDPTEQRDVAPLQPERVQEMRRLLEDHLASFGDPLGRPVGRKLERSDLEALKALGYLND